MPSRRRPRPQEPPFSRRRRNISYHSYRRATSFKSSWTRLAYTIKEGRAKRVRVADLWLIRTEPMKQLIHMSISKTSRRGGSLQYHSHRRQRFNPLTRPSIRITATMKPYQLAGLSFLIYLHKNGLSGILGDEMGLGKTLQTLSLFQHLKENDPPSFLHGERRPFLVVCPLSVLSSWMTEIARWTPQLKAIRFHGSLNERARLKRVAEGLEDRYGNQLETRAKQKRRPKGTASAQAVVVVDSDSDQDIAEVKGVDIVVTTYETFLAEQSWFKRAFVWRYVVLDEGHKIKNDLSLVSVALHGLQAEFRLILTGYVSIVPDRRRDPDGLAGPHFRTIC